MANTTIPRRGFLKATTLGGAALASGLSDAFVSPAKAQNAVQPAAANPRVRPADIVLKNGKIITVDSAFSATQAIAISGDRIVAVGPDAAMAAHTSPETRVVDLKGKAVVPGLTDGHAHMDREALRNIFPVAWAGSLDP